MQDAQIATVEPQPVTKPTLLPLRDDTILGVCEAVGEDFGFNPLWLRIGLSAALLWNPTAIVGGYLAVGAVLAISRFVFPPARAARPDACMPAEAMVCEARPEPAQEERELIAA